jgi:hypothetical protein
MSVQTIATKLKGLSANSFTRTAAVIGILAAVGGPAAMLAFGGSQASNVPWYIWLVVALVLLSVISAGFFMFRVNRDDLDISINPRNVK